MYQDTMCRSFHHTDRVAKVFISSHRQSCDQTLNRQTLLHKHVCSFHQTPNRTRNLDEAAHDEPEFMAPTSCLTLMWKVKERMKILGMCPRTLLSRTCSSRCGSHIMWFAPVVDKNAAHLKSDEVLVATTQAPLRETCGQKTPAQIQHN